MQCEFATDYFDHQTKDKIRYECTETAKSSKYCIFHDKVNFKKNIQKINAGVKEKINYAILTNTAITMIGYNIAKIDITKKKFYNSVKFVKSIFHEEASFHNSEFLNHVDFSDVRFKKIARFDESIFKKEVNFLNIAIKKQGIFTGCIFAEKVNFNSSILYNCIYSNCIFAEADFSSILFIGNISFDRTIFKNKVTFNSSRFNKVNFNKARFDDEVNLDAKFRDRANIHNVVFSKQLMVYLAKDLSKISFLGTNITRIRFSNEVIWNNDPVNPFGRFLNLQTKNEEYKIYDERRLEKGFKNMFVDRFPDRDIDKFVNDFVDEFIDRFKDEFRDEINDIIMNEVTDEGIDELVDEIIDDFLYKSIDKFVDKFKNEFVDKFIHKFKIKFADRFVNVFDDESIDIFVDEIRDYFLDEVRNVFRDEVRNVFRDEVRNVFRDEVRDSVMYYFVNDFRDEFRDIFRDTFKDEFLNDFRDDSSKDFEDNSIEAVLDVYRNLRDNFDFNLKYDKSREFFVREMNVKKNYEKSEEENKIILKRYFSRQISFLNGYNIIAQYGNSIYRPMYALALIISILTISFFTDEFRNIDKILQPPPIQNIINTGIQNTIGFIPFTSTSNISIRDNITTTDIILKIIALPILGTLYIAFKRRFERTLRH